MTILRACDRAGCFIVRGPGRTRENRRGLDRCIEFGWLELITPPQNDPIYRLSESGKQALATPVDFLERSQQFVGLDGVPRRQERTRRYGWRPTKGE